MYRGLIYHWRRYLPVLLATMIAAAVVTGALVVGDSVRASLRGLVLDRIGSIDAVLYSQRLVETALADRLQANPLFRESFSSVVPIIKLEGGGLNPRQSRRASSVAIHGITPAFGTLFDRSIDFSAAPRQLFPSVILNRSLSIELGVSEGDQVVFSLMKESEVSRETLIGSRDPSEVIQTIRGVVKEIVEDSGMGQFTLRPTQSTLLNAYFERSHLQRAMQEDSRGDRANLFLLSGGGSEAGESLVDLTLPEALTLEDVGLKLLESGEGVLVLEGSNFVLAPRQVEVALQIAEREGLEAAVTLTYLANRLAIGDTSIPYSTVVAIQPVAGQSPRQLRLRSGEVAPALQEDALYLNSWAGDQLGARVGHSVDLDYYQVGARDVLSTRSTTLRVAGIVGMDGLGADPTLTPQFPGIHDADDMAHWDPPFPVDLARIRPQDEDYWDRFGAAPKAFVSMSTARRLWATRYGDVTSVRLTPASQPVSQVRARFERGVMQSLTPRETGFQFDSVRARGMRASRGPTDFAGLFIGFSFFLIVAALLLVTLLFRLATENRSQELGILGAVGYSGRRIRRLLLGEARLILLLGSLLGVLASLLYAWIMLAGLRTWWQAAVGTTALSLHASWQSVVAGWLITVLSAFLAVWFSLRWLLGFSATSLLSGRYTLQEQHREREAIRLLRRLGLVASLLAVPGVLLLGSALEGYETVLFFGLAILVLVTLLLSFAGWCRSPETGGGGMSWFGLAIRNSRRSATRSIVSVTLVALATFTILSVGANRVSLSTDMQSRSSATGGFQLVAKTDIPILQDLNTQEGRFQLSLDDPDDTLEGVHTFPLRVQPGDDASCLNLYRPERPRVLGVPEDFMRRGGFTFSRILADATPAEQANPWLLLKRDLGKGVVPAIGDFESVQWILQLGLGQDVEMTDESGNPLRLRLVGLLHGSLFQSELLVSEDAFQGAFPAREGYSYFLVDTGRQPPEPVLNLLESSLGDHGFDGQDTLRKLAGYMAVRNTYISTFETLGGLGLILGTLGLGVVLVRNVVDRRRELAVMRAFGFSRYSLSLMVVLENGWLLLAGLGIGFVSALLALFPHAGVSGPQSALGSMALTLVLVFSVGMLASLAAVVVSLRTPLLPALKTE